MPMHEEPLVGAVYEDGDGKKFEVIAFDENIGTLDVQYVDGTTHEIDLDDWYGMDLEKVESTGLEEDEDEEDESPVPDDDPDEDDDYSDDDDEEE